MLPTPQQPLLYLITSGETTVRTTPVTEDFQNVLRLVRAATDAGIDLLQIREKNLSASILYQLSANAAGIAKGSATRLLINDRSDIAAASGADGVHLTTKSLPAEVVRRAFGDQFLIGSSTHSLEEAMLASRSGADFIVYGPVFETASKREYGSPLGLTSLARVGSEMAPFPVLALGGVMLDNVGDCIRAGARGIAAIRMFNDPDRLHEVVKAIRARLQECPS